MAFYTNPPIKYFLACTSLMVIALFFISVAKIREKHFKLIPDHLLPLVVIQDKFQAGNLSAVAVREALRDTAGAVRNEELFGPLTPETPVLLVLAAADAERLQYLIISLGQVHHIEDALLVFSHSFYDNTINSIIGQIKFCRVLQIFYPNSVQMHPDSFPGTDKHDCTNDKSEFCVANRDGRLTEGKHHWWWTCHEVFEGHPLLRGLNDYVIFISENSYVLPDLLYMLNYARRSVAVFNQVEVLAFGRLLTKGKHYGKFSVGVWTPLCQNGLAFNRSTWQKIWALSSKFCEYDDVSWSYSLQHLFTWLTGRQAMMAVCQAPRVLSTAFYSSGKKAFAHYARVARAAPLYPERVQASVFFDNFGHGMVINKVRVPPRGNGGWWDPRDRALCNDPMQQKQTTASQAPTKNATMEIDFLSQKSP